MSKTILLGQSHNEETHLLEEREQKKVYLSGFKRKK